MTGRLRTFLFRLERLVLARMRYRFFVKEWAGLADMHTAAQVLNTMRTTHAIDPVELDGPLGGERIVVIAPHPDDEVIGPGGTIIKALAGGATVSVIYLTSDLDPRRAETREAEARQVAAKLGFECTFLRWPPGAIPIDAAASERFAAAVMSTSPSQLFLPFFLDDHDDHRRASEVLLAAHRAGRLADKLEIWAYQVYSAVLTNVVVDVTSARVTKEDAIRLYASQMRSRDWANFATGLSAWTSRLLRGRSTAAFAEAFLVLPLSAYAHLAQSYFLAGPAHTYVRHYRAGGIRTGN